MAKHKCERCGELKREGLEGVFISCDGCYPEGKFFCYRCLKVREKEETDQRFTVSLPKTDGRQVFLQNYHLNP